MKRALDCRSKESALSSEIEQYRRLRLPVNELEKALSQLNDDCKEDHDAVRTLEASLVEKLDMFKSGSQEIAEQDEAILSHSPSSRKFNWSTQASLMLEEIVDTLKRAGIDPSEELMRIVCAEKPHHSTISVGGSKGALDSNVQSNAPASLSKSDSTVVQSEDDKPAAHSNELPISSKLLTDDESKNSRSQESPQLANSFEPPPVKSSVENESKKSRSTEIFQPMSSSTEDESKKLPVRIPFSSQLTPPAIPYTPPVKREPTPEVKAPVRNIPSQKAWKGWAAAPRPAAKSLAEIQAEEARQREISAAKQNSVVQQTELSVETTTNSKGSPADYTEEHLTKNEMLILPKNVENKTNALILESISKDPESIENPIKDFSKKAFTAADENLTNGGATSAAVEADLTAEEHAEDGEEEADEDLVGGDEDGEEQAEESGAVVDVSAGEHAEEDEDADEDLVEGDEDGEEQAEESGAHAEEDEEADEADEDLVEGDEDGEEQVKESGAVVEVSAGEHAEEDEEADEDLVEGDEDGEEQVEESGAVVDVSARKHAEEDDEEADEDLADEDEDGEEQAEELGAVVDVSAREHAEEDEEADEDLADEDDEEADEDLGDEDEDGEEIIGSLAFS